MKKLWYRQPAGEWEEVLPLGNGSLGAMLWGNPGKEIIGLNQERLWSGKYIDHNPRDAERWLPEVRERIYRKEYESAERLMEAHFLGEYTESYMPAGNLILDFAKAIPESLQQAENYRRELELDTARAFVSFRCGNNQIRREAFVSYPQKALLLRWDCTEPLSEVTIEYESRMIRRGVKPVQSGLEYSMQCPEHADPHYLGKAEKGILWGDEGMEFTVSVRILETDGQLEIEEDRLILRNARTVCAAVSILDRWQETGKTFVEYEQEHIADYSALYSRVELEMPGRSDLPTDEWLQNPDPGLYALYYQYGRYLLISSARPGSLPPNLQGIWCWQLLAPWSSNWTTNINTEMNEWPALTANLMECTEPYVEMVRRICREGRKTAAAFGCRGSCAAHNTDGWGQTNPVGVVRGNTAGNEGCLLWAFWLMAEVWMDQEIWRIYWYHPDPVYLRETVYPLLKESVYFCLDWLTMHEGYYVTCPSTTPENQFLHNGKRISVSMATTMDMTLIRELFRNFKRAAEQLRCDPAWVADPEAAELEQRIDEVGAKLYPTGKNADGSVCEWYEEKEEAEPGHRHLSHLYGLFPSDLWREDSDMREACRKSLENRMSAGGGHTGWSLAWVLNLYVVLQDRDKVEQYLKQMMQRSTYPNLWSKHPPYQIDGNFGAAAAIGHMLAAEKEGEIELLPCLPASWKEGRVKGLCLPGGRQVSFAWKSGKAYDVQIRQEAANQSCR